MQILIFKIVNLTLEFSGSHLTLELKQLLIQKLVHFKMWLRLRDRTRKRKVHGVIELKVT